MTREDCRKIFILLSKFYPNAKLLKDTDAVIAWAMVLERYPYDRVKSNVLTHAAKSKYFPDVADLTGNLIAEETPEEAAAIMERTKKVHNLICKNSGKDTDT